MNQIISSSWFDYSKNIVLEKRTFEYNSIGNLITETSFASDNKIRGVTKYKYDNLQRIVEYNYYDNNGNLDWSRKCNYDDNNKLLESISIYSKENTRKKEYKYDDYGNINEESEYNSDGSLEQRTVFEYYYDKNNNWTKKITYKNEVPKFIVEREIIYF